MTAGDGSPFDVFVYGTLKRGHDNHERYCSGVRRIQPATTRGSLYDLPFGFPGLTVAPGCVLARGTDDYAADARRQREAEPPFPSGPGPTVFGELLSFDDPDERLPALDALEGYRPGEPSLYGRVLIPVRCAGRQLSAWAYALQRPAGTLLAGGHWPVQG